jgi:hypothetical protein
MARSAASIQSEITALDAAIATAINAQSYSIAGRSKSNQSLDSLTKRRDQLQQQLDRTNGSAPMLVRGTVTGMR